MQLSHISAKLKTYSVYTKYTIKTALIMIYANPEFTFCNGLAHTGASELPLKKAYRFLK